MASVKIRCRHGSSASFGSGTVVAQEGDWVLVVTCRHLGSKDTGLIQVTYHGGQQFDAIHYDVAEDGADLAMITVKVGSWKSPIAPLGEPGSYTPGTMVHQAGWPGGGQLVRRSGSISSVSNKYEGSAGQRIPAVDLNFGVIGGDSGSGVFDSSGKLVAVVWGSAGRSTCSTGLEEIKKLYDQKCFRFFPNLFPNLQRPPTQRPGPSAPPASPVPPSPGGPAPSPAPSCPCTPGSLGDIKALGDKIAELSKQLAELQAKTGGADNTAILAAIKELAARQERVEKQLSDQSALLKGVTGSLIIEVPVKSK